MLKNIVKFIETLVDLIKSIFKWVLNSLDTLALIFTYLSILIVTVYLVKSCLEGSTVTPIVCSISIFTLMKVNQGIRGGGK